MNEWIILVDDAFFHFGSVRFTLKSNNGSFSAAVFAEKRDYRHK